MSIWWACWLLSAAWLMACNAYDDPRWGWAAALLAGSLAVCVWLARSGPKLAGGRRWLGCAVAAALAAVVFPPPWAAPPALASLGALALAPTSSLPWLRTVGRAGVLLGVVTSCQAVALVATQWLLPRAFAAPCLDPLTGGLFSLLRLGASVTDSCVTVPRIDYPAMVSVSLHRLGLEFAVPFVVGGLVACLLTGRRRSIPGLLGIGLAYAVIRYAVVTALAAEIWDMGAGLAWRPWYVLLSFALLPLVLPRASSTPAAEGETAATPPQFAPSWALAALAAGCACMLMTSLCFRDPGQRKAGRVLIDETHSNWEWSDIPFDTETYGPKTTYNYYCMAWYLSKCYEVERFTGKRYDDTVLRDCDVLILKTPTVAFNAEERAAIDRFVRRGGGVWLVGDHTNVFGTSARLNALCRPWGLAFNHDSTYCLQTGDLSLYRPSRFLAHPVAAGMPEMQFETSCTLSASPAWETVIRGIGLRAVRIDYSQRSFFPERDGPRQQFDSHPGAFLQACARRLGRGRVLAFSDSTCFSNFSVFLPGKRELFMGSVEWLNRRAWLGWMNGGAAFAAGGLFVALVAWGRRLRGSVLLPWLTAWGWVGAALSAILCSGLQSTLWRVPAPAGELVNCCFDGSLCDADFSMQTPHASLAARGSNEYQTMLVWCQRLGWVPFVGERIVEDVRRCRVLVVVNPSRAPTATEAAALLGFVEGGGRLVVATCAPEKADAARQEAAGRLLAPFGLWVRLTARAEKELTAPGRPSFATWPALKPCEARGGRALLVDSRNRPVLAVARYGQGAVAVFVDSGLFADKSIGTVWSTPTPRQVRISHLLYYVLESADPQRPVRRPAH